ncbi:hypothetical protein EUBDOL_00887 [Amedibacillus dolichus DSM 3991]|uniref:Uncharacterized protein n=1 Tax=Amedibacillus dolichus DSM 3991 TaxID=428127 RepID=A8RAR2_9FIRM|nr:hypothetical protein EUBDOL_00887 [Amedibacillus dolichus DSM 3991]
MVDMRYYEPWLMKQHAWSAKAHHFANLFTHFALVTVYLAVGTKTFGFHKGTAIDSLTGIFQ